MNSFYNNKLSIQVLLFIVIVVFTHEVSSHRCYVCAPSHSHKKHTNDYLKLKKEFPDSKIRKCSEFHKSIKDDFIKECSKGVKGCLTKFEAGSVMRSCAQPGVSVDDCKDANGITYCYCKNNECNSAEKKIIGSFARRRGLHL